MGIWFNFDFDGHNGRGNSHVADTQPLLGIDLIMQNEPIFRSLAERSSSSAMCPLQNRLRSTLIIRLQKQFPAAITQDWDAAPNLRRASH